ncbi:ABC transporter substrate-binding protein [Saprospira grandis]|uniref:Periplasmic binding protein n=1 Tax=Saprospira grandis (strain Lewin) TaxID=984262 RepID=H6L730_SAPGL|nr:helical backbone metal receptor [Saprospira grandis]AFC26621.1 periplasmic binding protein [Saprospira grandis str. Lewin]
MPIYIDQMGRSVRIAERPQRIISLVPSQTEWLADLGLEQEVIALTKFCIHPKAWWREKERIGGTKSLDLDKIRSLQPDLIIANKEENSKAEIELLAQEFPVWISDIANLPQALEMMRALGQITGQAERAESLLGPFEEALAAYQAPAANLSVAYFIWRQPWMLAAGQTFIDEMLNWAGFKNALGHLARYPSLSLKELEQEKIDLIFLSSEPYPFKEKHIAELKEIWPNSQILLVDGEIFSWYGSRLFKAPDYCRALWKRILAAGKLGG